MPRSSKRKAAPPPPSSSSSSSSVTSSSTGKSKMKDINCIDKLFDCYANTSLGMIDPEGIETLCSDMQVEHTDVRILMLAWKLKAQKQGKLKAQKQGYFTKEEWRTGLKALQSTSVYKLKEALPVLEKEVEAPENFEDFYSYSFRYCLTEEKQKYIDIESICELLNLVLGSRFHSKVDLLTEYLKIQSEYKVINLDQWVSFLRFCKEINFPDLENYDDTMAWPLILDNFVEWMKEKHRQLR